MKLKTLKLKNFRNYTSAHIDDLSPGFNIIYGDNAQGKTNLLEAVAFLSCAKSFRTQLTGKLIREGAKSALVYGEYVGETKKTGSGSVEAGIFLGEKKSIKVDGLPVTKVSDMIGQINAVVFCPEDMRAVKEGPALRRRILDIELSKLRPSYFLLLQDYNKILRQKNRLLKFQNIDETLLEVYNDGLCEIGSKIIERRRAYFEKLSAAAADFAAKISTDELIIKYLSSVTGEDILAELKEKTKLYARREREMKMSLVGPHREDIEFIINGKSAKLTASQGQQRTAMLALKLASAEVVRNISGEHCIMLLDDVFSELDKKRKTALLTCLDGGQVFITATEVGNDPRVVPGNCKKFYIENGQVIGKS